MFFGWNIAILIWQRSLFIDASLKHGWSFHSSSIPQCFQNWDIADPEHCPVIDFANWKGWIDIHNIFRVFPIISEIFQTKPKVCILYPVLDITGPPHCIQNLMWQEHRYEAMISSMPAWNLVTRGWSLAWCILLITWYKTTWNVECSGEVQWHSFEINVWKHLIE